MTTFEVRAHWDAEARVWWAESDDIKGLVAEAGTLEELVTDLKSLIPELLRLNHDWHGTEFEFKITADRLEGVRVAA